MNDNVYIEMVKAIDEKIISDMKIISDKCGNRLSWLPGGAVDDLIRILVRGGYESMASACDQVIMVLDYSTEELPLHVNDGGIVEATTVWRLRHGI